MKYIVPLRIMVNAVWFYSRNARGVRNDSETHKTVLLDCTTGEAGSAIQ